MNQIDALSTAFHSAARVSRSTLYGVDEDQQLPRNLQMDARVPFLGCCGGRYTAGGTVLLAINPGGGGDAYVARTPQDEQLIPQIERFVAAQRPTEMQEAFRTMSASYLSHAMTWNLWRILGPTLDACGRDADEIVYLNLFPYRTARDAVPASHALAASWRLVISPLLEELKPATIVALGKKAGKAATRLHNGSPPLEVVPRTIGDSYISDEAQKVLESIRARANDRRVPAN